VRGDVKEPPVSENGSNQWTRSAPPTAMDRADGLLSRAMVRLGEFPRAGRLALALSLVALVALLDVATGAEISFSIIYLAPVAFAGWFMSRRDGAVVAVLGAFVWGYLEVTTGRAYSADWIPVWNTSVRLGFFLLVNELLERLRRAHVREQQLSRQDSLTGIANARVFEERAREVIARSRRTGSPTTLVYLDLDHFKRVNDEMGHSEGDRVLKAVASSLERSVRETDMVVRLGGDEFAVLMPDTDQPAARVALDRALDAIEREVGSRWPVGATFGAVTFVEPPTSVDCAVRAADGLMYEGKAAGRGQTLYSLWPSDDAPTCEELAT